MWKVTHIDADGKRHKLMVPAPNGRVAEAWAIQLYGLPRRLSLIRLAGVEQ